jgi:hypothetical protein
MGFKAKVAHQYEPRDEDELCIKKGEIVTITDSNYGNAWWYGAATNGVQGFISELYVELAQFVRNVGVDVVQTIGTGPGQK